MAQTQPLRPDDPVSLGEYRLVGLLGEGAQGVVYAGTGPDGEDVAIKLLRARLGETGVDDADGFLREVSAARRVAQFCTAQVLGAFMDGEHPYIVSELVDGVSLQRVVHDEGPRRDGALYRLAVGTITALAAIHRAGIVHRDFKPSNVLLGPDGPRVIDFGISRALDASVTLSSGVVGTPAYMSPEQIGGQRVGPPSDLFSWAVTMIYAATGGPAFGFDSLPAVIYRVINEEPDVSQLPDRLRPLVQSCLAKRPEDRPTAAEALFVLLDQQGAERNDLERSMTAGLQVAAAPANPFTSPSYEPREERPANPFASPSYEPREEHSGNPFASPSYQRRPADPSHERRDEHSVTVNHRLPDPVFFPETDEPRAGQRAKLVAGALAVVLALAATALFVVPSMFAADDEAKVAVVAQITSSAIPPLIVATPSSTPSFTPDPVATPSAPPAVGKPIGKALSGHRGAVYSVAAANVGGTQVLISTGLDRQVRLWNADSRKSIGKPMTGHFDEVYAVAAATVSGRALAVTGSRDGTVRVWDLKKRKALGGPMRGHSNAVYAVAVGKVGDRWVIVSGGADGRIRMWDLEKRKPIGRAIAAHRNVINWLALGKRDGKTIIISASEDRTLRMWSASTRKRVGATFRAHKKPVYSVTTGVLDGRDVIASGGEDNKIRIWDPKTGKAVGKTLTGHKNNVYSLAFGEVNDHPVLVSGSTDGTIRLWDLETYRALGKAVKAHKGGVFSVDLVEIDRKPVIVSAGKDRRLKMWQIKMS
ncbi:serine/threonine-protein kinase [Acrocarpospora corrugata]|uniref:serine/threonine-protein kinase n=1 Tax=Acrocarpospora corrugata TaxID=35763 RepID=UPI001478C6C0|nr:serine/threonine-protein kinase [Acrocarpospora corrugata]